MPTIRRKKLKKATSDWIDVALYEEEGLYRVAAVDSTATPNGSVGQQIFSDVFDMRPDAEVRFNEYVRQQLEFPGTTES